MSKIFVNQAIIQRFDELISEGEQQLWEQRKHPGEIHDPTKLTQWTTSSLNLLDKLSIASNRFVTEFERYGRVGSNGTINLGLALGVLKAAREEYLRGLAVDYHLSVSAAVFSDLLEESHYLLSKSYLRAAAVLAGAALEEELKARAKVEKIELSQRDTLVPIVHKLKADEVGALTEFEARKLEALGKFRNDAAHGGDFQYTQEQVAEMVADIEKVLARVLGRQ